MRLIPPDRMDFTFWMDGVRDRQTLRRVRTEATLRLARMQVADIKRRIANGTFSCAEEFPDDRYMRKLGDTAARAHLQELFDDSWRVANREWRRTISRSQW